MNIKKILAISLLLLAVFSCMSAVSAGLFDFFGGGEPTNQTYTFDGFTLDLPSNANITNNTTRDDGVVRKTSNIEWETGSGDNAKYSSMKVTVSKGEQVVESADEYLANWMSSGAKSPGNHGKWVIIDINGVPIEAFAQYNLNITYSGYILGYHDGSKLIALSGDNLTELENVADTFKAV